MNRILILVFGLSIIFGLSCTKITEDVTAKNALVGRWTVNGTPSVLVTVEGVDAVQYLMDNFGYTEEEAGDIVDNVIEDLTGHKIGVITLFGNNTFYFSTDTEGEPDGSWSISADGKILNLVTMNKDRDLIILEQASNEIRLQLPTVYRDADIDADGENETTFEIIVEQRMKKANGGMGQ